MFRLLLLNKALRSVIFEMMEFTGCCLQIFKSLIYLIVGPWLFVIKGTWGGLVVIPQCVTYDVHVIEIEEEYKKNQFF